MLDLINQGKFDKNETILFWHTGGTPVMFAEPYREILSKYLRTA
jgi:D-cysteine desulfhydrase